MHLCSVCVSTRLSYITTSPIVSNKKLQMYGLTHGLTGSIHFSINGSKGGQLCRAASQAYVQLIICGHLIVRPLQVLLILQPCNRVSLTLSTLCQQARPLTARKADAEHSYSIATAGCTDDLAVSTDWQDYAPHSVQAQLRSSLANRTSQAAVHARWMLQVNKCGQFVVIISRLWFWPSRILVWPTEVVMTE